MERTINKEEISSGLKELGVGSGDTLLVHSAMRTLGRVEGGGPAVSESLIETVGPTGTVVTPAFTFRHEAESEPIIDPANDVSEMGAVSEAVRRHRGASRSAAFRHSFSAIGKNRTVITEVDPRLSPFDLRSSFGVMLALNAQIILIGVTYSSATGFHFAEWLADVPYRHFFKKPARIRRTDGSIENIEFVDYQPKPSGSGGYYGKRTMDFNFFGAMLEQRQKVSIATIGNAIVRRFSIRDLCDLAQRELERDFNLFRTSEENVGKITPLKDGTIVQADLVDGAGRASRTQWSVRDPRDLRPPKA